ncbi:hypothetical protein [Pseudalkalibacillus sp. SCS-8]|uniref:hypothetical protein n=1 Tax=Pseudalkalibacillus nanhaiensis TaxID=3115291 RepID=UPI0032DBD6DC
MWSAIGTILLIAMIVLIDGVPLRKRKQSRDLRVYAILLAVGTGLLIYQTTGNELPTPLYAIKWVLDPVSRSFYQFFE